MLAQDSFIYIVEVNPINKIWHMSFWNSAITSYFQIAQLFFWSRQSSEKRWFFPSYGINHHYRSGNSLKARKKSGEKKPNSHCSSEFLFKILYNFPSFYPIYSAFCRRTAKHAHTVTSWTHSTIASLSTLNSNNNNEKYWRKKRWKRMENTK